MNLLNQQDQENLVKILGELVKIDGGAQREINEDDFNFIVNFLKKNDFDIIEIIEDENFVPNLFALRRKNNQENKKIDLCFLGHLDVVDSGDFKFWKNQNPFEIFEENNILFGRGMSDMKGGIAAFLYAISKFSDQQNFNLGIMICSDEEKESKGAIALKEYVLKNNFKIEQILIGEPTSEEKLGDVIKIGRRGSANFDLIFCGVQGHVAYPELAKNPINQFSIDIIKKLIELKFNDENEFFDSSNLVITKIETEPKSELRNVSPDSLKISFNIRYNNSKNLENLKGIINNILGDLKNECSLKVFSNFSSFLSKKTKFLEIISDSVKEIKNFEPLIKTNGGTSDGRFFHDISPIIELGPLNQSAHKINENISKNDLFDLYKIYLLGLKKFNNFKNHSSLIEN